MLLYWIWLAEHPDLTEHQKTTLAQHFPDPEELYFADGKTLKEFDPGIVNALQNRDLTPAKAILRKCAQRQIQLVCLSDAEYPNRLRNIPDPPMVLYYKGELPDFASQPVIAVVGTRKATPYGLTVTDKLARQISICGGLVLSGAADGIDAAAMKAALETGNPVVGILGNGLDVVYPRSNRTLYADAIKNGCLISEYPPESRPEAWHFPRRNRIISGLANGVLVVEAPEKSGALITARYALEQGRDVFVVPGNVDMPTCAGSNALLEDGAGVALSGWSIMREYEGLYPDAVKNRCAEDKPALAQVAQPGPNIPSDKKDVDNPLNNSYSGIENSENSLSEEENKILSVLSSTPKHTDSVIAETGINTAKALSLLTKLALKGFVVNHPGKLVSKSKRRK